MKKNIPILCLLALLIGNNIFSQGWKTVFDPPYAENAWSVRPTFDGGYMVLHAVNSNERVTYLNASGDSIWTKVINSVSASYAKNIIQTKDSNFVVCGSQNSQGLLLWLDANGDTLARRLYPNPPNYSFNSLRETPDGGFILSGFRTSTGVELLRVDSIGDTLWSRNYSGSDYGESSVVENTLEGGFIATGSRNRNTYEYPVLINTDGIGDTNWTFEPSYIPNIRGKMVDVAQYPDSTYLALATIQEFVGTSEIQYGLVYKLDQQGDTLWTQKIDLDSDEIFTSLALTPDGGFATLDHNIWAEKTYLARFDSMGTQLWVRDFPGLRIWGNRHSNLWVTQDNGFVFSGRSFATTYWSEAITVKTDSMGYIYPNVMAGYVYKDGDGNCGMDSTEVGLAGTIVKAENIQDGDLFYGITDTDGYYEMRLSTGIFITGVDTINPYSYLWATPSCTPAFVQDTLAIGDSIYTDFPRIPTAYCPLLSVDIGAPFLRRCFPNRLSVQYQNLGTETAFNPIVEVELGPDFTVDSASIPWSSVSDTLVIFQLDSLIPGEMGSFYIDLTLDSACTNTILNEVRCASAHIYPDSGCAPANPYWDSSSVAVTADCIQDSAVRLAIYNNGSNSMTTPSHVIIVEDNILRLDTNVTLNAGDSLDWSLPANGSTWFIRADQSLGHPGRSHPAAFVEGCGTNGNGGISTGFAPTYPMDNSELFHSTYCAQLRGAYDPNEKIVHPAGRTAQHLIDYEQQLDYTLRFQNTGTDTAFTVVIVDTLPSELEVGTLLSGAASHPYTFELLGSGIARWTFANILLPDSNRNEPGSHGFVRFSIDHAPNLPPGTRINNAVEIFFDFNAPVITDTAFVTLSDGGGYIIATLDEEIESASLTVYPNPFSHSATIDLNQTFSEVNLEVFDLQGRLIFQKYTDQANKLTFQSDQLEKGIYLFRVSSNGELLGSGRMAVMR